MSISKTETRPSPLLSDEAEAGLKKFVRQTLGFGLLLLSVAGWLSLLTWSIQDPSLNHATNEAPTNFLGVSGAILADVLFQAVGLSAILVFLVPVIWSLQLMADVGPRRGRIFVIHWPMCVVAVSGFLSGLPATGSWPLPNGLGGVIGDKLLSWFDQFFGHLSFYANATSYSLLFLLIGLWSLRIASGISFKDIKILFPKKNQGFRLLFRTVITKILNLLFSKRNNVELTEYGTTEFETYDTFQDFEPAPQEPPPLTDEYPPLPKGILPDNPGFRKDSKGFGSFFGKRLEPYFDMEPIDTDDLKVRRLAEFTEKPETETWTKPPHPGRTSKSDAGSQVRTPHVPTTIDARSGAFSLPSLQLLQPPQRKSRTQFQSADALQSKAQLLEVTLKDFGVHGQITAVHAGPVVTLYEFEPARGTKSSRVIGLAEDIARSMSTVSARIAVVPGHNAIGIELPNDFRETVYLRQLLEDPSYSNFDASLALALGQTISGEPLIVDLARMPHLLMAGTTGSGKSVGINTMILSLLYRLTPDQCKFIMIDPKMLELSVYDGIPHLLSPVVTDPKKAVVALKWTVREMEERYKNMSKLGVRNIDGYNNRIREAEESGEPLSRTVQTGFDRETGHAIYEREMLDLKFMPYIVVVIDEMADLMMVAGKEIESAVQRLAQMARAAGIHLITATQRPSVDVITGTIKANFPTRISFQVTTKIDSRTILGEQGAEQLLGAGDMLYMASGGRSTRIHGPFVSDQEVEQIVNHLKSQGIPEYLEAITLEPDPEAAATGDCAENGGDTLFKEAVEIITRDRRASTSYLQRRLSIGYNRAATLIERLEDAGYVSPANSSGKREVLIQDETSNY